MASLVSPTTPAGAGEGDAGLPTAPEPPLRLLDRAITAARVASQEVDRIFAEECESPGLVRATRAGLREFLSALVECVASGEGDFAPVSPKVEEHVIRWASEGLSLSSLVQLYGIVHRFGINAAVCSIESDPCAPDLVNERLARLADLPLVQVNLTEGLMGIFGQLQRPDRRSVGNWRLRLVRRLLAGEEVDETPLGYPLGGMQVAVVARGPGAEAAASMVQEGWPGRTLRICEKPEVLWLWLATASSRRSVVPKCRFAVPQDTVLAFGDPAAGRTGFSDSHRQAQAALWLAAPTAGSVRYEQVALVALLTQAEGSARRFIAEELGPLNVETDAGMRDRDTVRAYLDCQCNVASTAARIGIHENTVAKRLRKIEEQLGIPLRARSTELDVALRLRALGPKAWLAGSPSRESS